MATLFCFGLVTLLTLFLWRGRLQGAWLIAALLLTAAWGGYLGFVGGSSHFNPTNQTFLDVLRGASWSLLLGRLIVVAGPESSNASFWRNHWLWGFAGWVVLLLLANTLSSLGVLTPTAAAMTAFGAPFSLSLITLVLLEQWYRRLGVEHRWGVKFLCVAIAVMFVSDFLLYSEALLFKGLDADLWEARGWIYAAMAPLVAISVARCRDWSRENRLSHRAVFFTSSLLLAGVYLVVMALVGYYLRWFGSGLGNAVQVVFVVLSLSLLTIVLMSGRYRSLLAVWISKHFLSYKYDYREQWMRANARFAALKIDDDSYVQLVLGIAEPIDSTGGAIWIEDEGALMPKAHWSLALDMPLLDDGDGGLLQYCLEQEWVINVPEYRRHPERYEGLELPKELLDEPRLWLLVPLIHQQHLYGMVALAEPRTERSVTWEDHDLLKALAGQVASLLAQRKLTESLANARQFEAYNQLSTFVVHDIKNVVAQLSLVVRNAERHRRNPEFVDDALDTLSNAVGRMNRMLSQLKQGAEPGPEVQVDAGEIAREVLAAQAGGAPVPQLDAVAESCFVEVDRDRLLAALCHLVQNAQDATPSDGSVVLSVVCEGSMVGFVVADSGAGMSAEFMRSGLFKPFVSTKGRAGMGIGVFEARQFARLYQGELQVESKLGKGSTFTLLLPNARLQSELGVVGGQG
nr:XrtA/PEP-CTERM system histidine kinase PrsK [Motiliproteus sediminis]